MGSRTLSVRPGQHGVQAGNVSLCISCICATSSRIIPHNSVHLHFLLQSWSGASSTLIAGGECPCVVQFCLEQPIPVPSLKMDIKICLQHLAKSLELIGLNISPTTWNISDNGSQLCMNIVFNHRPSYQGLQLRNFDDQSEKTFQKKSRSTLKLDRARMDEYLKKLEKKMSITPENAPHQISDNRLNFNVDAPDFMPTSFNIIKKSELVDNKAFSVMAELTSFSPPTQKSELPRGTRPTSGRPLANAGQSTFGKSHLKVLC